MVVGTLGSSIILISAMASIPSVFEDAGDNGYCEKLR